MSKETGGGDREIDASGRDFARPIGADELRRRVERDEFPGAAMYAALAIGQWVGVLGGEGAKRPDWAFDACREFYVCSRLWPGIFDPAGERSPFNRSDLARLMRVLVRNTGFADEKATSLRRAIEEDTPLEMDRKDVESTIRRIAAKFRHLVGDGGKIPDDLFQLICRFEASRRGGPQLGD